MRTTFSFTWENIRWTDFIGSKRNTTGTLNSKGRSFFYLFIYLYPSSKSPSETPSANLWQPTEDAKKTPAGGPAAAAGGTTEEEEKEDGGWARGGFFLRHFFDPPLTFNLFSAV